MLDVEARTASTGLRRRRPIWLGALLVYMVMIGGSEVGVFQPWLQVGNALIGALLVLWWMVLLRRGSDTTDLLAIGGLLAFLATCLLSEYPRQSFDAATAALVWAAAFGVARRVLVEPDSRVLSLWLLGACGLFMTAYFALAWGGAWADWFRLTGTLPPLDLSLPAHIYRHYHEVGMLIIGMMPGSLFLLRYRITRVPAALTLLIGTILTVGSGSRTAWLALLVGVTVAGLLFRPSGRWIAVAAGSVAVASILALTTGLMPSVIGRALTSGTVIYRIDIWSSTLSLWANDVLTGVGPGAFGIGITLTDLLDQHQYGSRHAHNALVQVAGEGGLVGLVGAGLLVSAVIVGRRLDLAGARVAVLGIALLAALSVTNNPTDSPNLVVLTIVYAALLSPFRVTHAALDGQQGRGRRILWTGAWLSAAIAGTGVLSISAAGVAHSAAIDASGSGDWSVVEDRLSTAVMLDPGLALYRREYGIVLATEGAGNEGIEQLRRAVTLNPADATAWRALAILGRASEGHQGAARAAELHPLSPESWLTASLVDHRDRRRGLGEALWVTPWLPGSDAWERHFPVGTELARIVDDAAEIDLETPVPLGGLPAAWLRILTTNASISGHEDVATQALAAVFNCDIERAEQLYAAMGSEWSASETGVVGRVMFARLVGTDAEAVLRIAALRHPALAAAGRGAVSPYSILADPITDAQQYRRLGIGVTAPGPIVPRSADALAAWMVDPVKAARRGATATRLATCSDR